MAWQDVTPIIGSSAAARHRVRYKVSRKFGCTVTVPRDVVELLGWKVGTHLKLAVGGGELLGKLKLSDDPVALPVLQKGKGADNALFVKLGRWPHLPDREVDRVAVEHQVEGRALILTLPTHALNVAPAAVRAAPTVAAKVDVTERVVGANGNKVAPLSGVRGQR